MKTTEEVKRKAAELQAPLTEFFRSHMGGYGDVMDELRVVGYLCEIMMVMCERELTALKLQDEADKPKIVLSS